MGGLIHTSRIQKATKLKGMLRAGATEIRQVGPGDVKVAVGSTAPL